MSCPTDQCRSSRTCAACLGVLTPSEEDLRQPEADDAGELKRPCICTLALSLNNPASDDTSDEAFENDMHKLDTIIGACRDLQKAMRRERRRHLR